MEYDFLSSMKVSVPIHHLIGIKLNGTEEVYAQKMQPRYWVMTMAKIYFIQ